MYRIIILIFILTNFVFSQKLFESHQVDSLNNSDFEKMYSINVMYSSYTLGVEEDAHLGHTLRVIYFYKFINPYFNEFKFKTGLFLINQKSLKSCEQIGKKDVDFYQPVLYFKTEYSSYFKHFMYKIGIALNTASESDLTCHNEIYFHPILINLELGLGDIDDFYFKLA